MPSTEFFGGLVTNLGPLTTTFTAAPSCATQDIVVEDTMLPGLAWRSECEFPSPASNCIPSASKYWDIYQSFRTGDIGVVGFAPYFSPASICPSGWTTVGAAGLSSGSATPSVSGVFTSPLRPFATLLGDGEGAAFGYHAWFLESLEDGETVIWCCPSGHKVDSGGVCLSTIGAWNTEDYSQFTTVCNFGLKDPGIVTVTSFDDKIWTPPLASLDDDATDYTSFYETLKATATGEYVVVHSVAAIALVHGGKNGDDEDDDSGNTDSDGGDDNDDNDDAAPSARTLSLLPFAAASAYGRCIVADYNSVHKDQCKQEFMRLKDCYIAASKKA
ncbi:hypothetical protein LIA77_03757 [Sarocladium implicatum]|nr:hypothetical protein LIA77_03757 [Sarocladium implicatum]